jgi:hypothetical protein
MTVAPASMEIPKRTIKTRRVKFDSSGMRRHYAGGDLVMSHIVAILSAMFPEGEDFFVRSVRHYSDQITDPELKAQVAGFIGQETMHGREHRALNDQLNEMGYPTHAVDRRVKRDLARAHKKMPPKMQLAITAALEHYTATLAEVLMESEKAREILGDSEVRNVLLWHALEESEHKSVAFDVYRYVGGTEKMRIRVMRMMTFSFLFGSTIETIFSMLRDRATYNPKVLIKSLLALRHSPWLSKDVRQRIAAYNKVGFHPDDNDNSALLAYWTQELFGTEGQLVGNLK